MWEMLLLLFVLCTLLICLYRPRGPKIKGFHEEHGVAKRRFVLAEKYLAAANECGMLIGGIAILVNKKIEASVLQQAVTLLQHRYPSLSYRCVRDPDGQLAAFAEMDHPPSSDAVQVVSGVTWQDYLLRDALLPLDLEKGPLWRIALLPDTNHIVLTGSHVIIDGRSALCLTNTLLKIYTLLSNGESTEVIMKKYSRLPHDRVRADLESWHRIRVFDYARGMYSLISRSFRPIKSSLLPLQKTSHDMQPMLQPMVFDKQLVDALLQKCRENKTTITGLMSAACAVAAAKVSAATNEGLSKAHERRIVLATHSDTSYLSETPSEDRTGNLTESHNVPARVSRDLYGPCDSSSFQKAFWSLASGAQQQLHRAIADTALSVAVTRMTFALVDKVNFHKENLDGGQRYRKQLGDVSISNMGKQNTIGDEEGYNAVELFPVMNGGPGYVFHNFITSLPERMCVALFADASIVSQENLALYARHVREILLYYAKS